MASGVAALTVTVVLAAVLTGAAPAATPAFTSGSSAASASSSTTLSLNRPTTVAAGSVLLATVAYRLDSTSAITPPSGWTDVVRTSCSNASNSITQAIFVKVATAAEPSAYAFTLATATGAAGSVLAYSGGDTARPVDVAAGRITRNSKGLNAPSVTTTVGGTRLVALFAHTGRSAITSPSGMTTRADATTATAAPSARALASDQVVAAAGATGDRKAGSGETNPCSVGQLVALRPGSDGPVNSSPPTVSGTAREGETLTASPGTWSGSPTSFAYQWQRSSNGTTFTDIGSATSASYVLASSDVGFFVRVVVTASNASGSASASSTATASVEGAEAPSNLQLPSISGNAREGDTLSATPGTWSGPTPSFAYAWERCDQSGQSCLPISGADDDTYGVGSADVGSTLRVVVTATSASGSSSATSATTLVVVPAGPVNSSPPTVSGTAREGETLTASPGTWSGSPTSFAYQWQRSSNGTTFTDIGSATSASYVLASSDVGFFVRVVVTASNASGSNSASSAATSAVSPLGPVNSSPPTVSGTAREGETLTASPGTWSGSPTSFAYQWQRSSNGTTFTDIGSATSASYVLASSDVGFFVRVVVTASNASGSASASSTATASVEGAEAPSNLQLPSISGNAREGDTLSATPGTWSGPTPSFAYAWERCDQSGQSCLPISGADDDTYGVGSADVGSTLRVVVTATSASGSSSATSATTLVVVPAGPVNSSPPTVSGTAREGETLTASPGTWSGSPTSFAYQWQRSSNGTTFTDIGSATSASYVLASSDVGFFVRVVVTASNASGSNSASSAATSAVSPQAPINQTLPTISGTFEEGELVTASPGSWFSSGPPSYTYLWQRSANGGTSWSDIAGADEWTYVLVSSDVGSVVRVVVTASTAGGSASAPSAASATVLSTGRPVNTLVPSFAGYAQQGRLLTGSAGTWSGSPTSYAYQWQRSLDDAQSWATIAGATNVNYTATATDVGASIRLVVTATNAFGQRAAVSHPVEIYPTGNLVVLVNTTWRCTAGVALDLVKVTVTTRVTDAVVLANGCTGRIGRVEVDTWTLDAMRVLNAATNAAHDLVIESGFAICHDLTPASHQDGLQVMGGARITLRNFVFACGDPTDEFGTGVAQGVLIARAGAGATTPTDIVVEHTVVMPGASESFAVGTSIRSGVRDSVLCPDRTGSSPFVNHGGAVDPINERNEAPTMADVRCTSFAAALAWATGS